MQPVQRQPSSSSMANLNTENDVVNRSGQSLEQLKANGNFSVKNANQAIFFWVDRYLGRGGRSLAEMGYQYGIRRLKLFVRVRENFDELYGESLPAAQKANLLSFPDELENFSLIDRARIFSESYGEQFSKTFNVPGIALLISQAWWLFPAASFFFAYTYLKGKK